MYRTRVNAKALFRVFQREGLSQNAAARKAGLSTATMSKVMSGKPISQSTAKQIIEAFGVDPDEILEIIEE